MWGANNQAMLYCVPAVETVGDGLGDLIVGRELGVLLMQPAFQCRDRRLTALVGACACVPRRQAVGVALDSEQSMDANGLHQPAHTVMSHSVCYLWPSAL